MRLFIAEDEPPARERLVETIGRVAPEARVVGWAASVGETAAWLGCHDAPDLLLLDIQLADGLSLELFRDGGPACPAIFTTAYDEFVLEALRGNAIDYLLKPIGDAALAAAFAKYARLRRHFSADFGRLLASLGGGASASRHRQRLVVRKGSDFVTVPVEQAAYFISADKLTFLVGCDGVRYLVDRPLAEIEAELDPAHFFRANRQYLVAARAVARFRPVGKGRLELALAPKADAAVLVSQERAGAFRSWIGQ
ncbi:LytR/AlgR family response regulator transcription factor [Chitinimonas koreensis]|uniref:LytR/AlgR family response regulator transcription factor n=1 Tax=Chitinimonas koreensis TaxID=356302 RepID=UPI000408275E|nr:LytTR family DNA-binding domain-containing protein [Chitinimonas koreensis]QNM96578.1 response regulator transcription factor [Chitinimonas koreensis]